MIEARLVGKAAADLYSRALRSVPKDTRDALADSIETESSDSARATLQMMLRSAALAEEKDKFVCSDSGFPTYLIEIGGRARWEGDIKQEIVDGFSELVATIDPPLLQHIANPLTNARGHAGKGIPAMTIELIDGADYIDVTCVPKALGSGRWASLKTFIAPSLDEIEQHVVDTMIEAGSQHCPPVIVGVGIGGNFDMAAKLANRATYRPVGTVNPEPMLQDMERRLAKAGNEMGFGPMGVGGDTTVLAVHVDFACGHGYTPVAVCFNCWINRKAKARFHADGRVETIY